MIYWLILSSAQISLFKTKVVEERILGEKHEGSFRQVVMWSIEASLGDECRDSWEV